MGSRLRIAGRVIAIGALALLMSSCLKLDMNLNVSSDNTVSGTVVFAVEKSLLELAGQSFDQLLASSAPLPSATPGVTVADYEDDQFSGKQYTFDAVPLSEFSGDGSDNLSITRDGDVFHVSGVLDLSAVGATGASGLSGFDPSQFLQSAELSIKMTFPGEVTSSNGQVSGNTVTWVPKIGERTELQATASAVGGGSSSNLLLWLIIGGAVVLIAIVVGVVVSQRRSAPAVATAGAGVEGGMAPPGVGPMTPPASGPTAPPDAGPVAPPVVEPPPPAPGSPAPPPPPGPPEQP
jgi:hypothetical protein